MAVGATTIQKTAKRDDSPEAGKPYHHGDLSRALIAAGRRILETEGPDALSVRAVAREAGVRPAAPYHHFKDKGELLDDGNHLLEGVRPYFAHAPQDLPLMEAAEPLAETRTRCGISLQAAICLVGEGT